MNCSLVQIRVEKSTQVTLKQIEIELHPHFREHLKTHKMILPKKNWGNSVSYIVQVMPKISNNISNFLNTIEVCLFLKKKIFTVDYHKLIEERH